MKAAVCYAFGEPLVIEDLRLRAVTRGEVQVRLAACAICHSDIHFAEGVWGGDLPAVYGHEAAGIVEVIGEAVNGVQVGDHVVVSLIRACGNCYHCERGEEVLCEGEFAADALPKLTNQQGEMVLAAMNTGAFAEAVVVDASQVVVIPKSVALGSAALLACGVITGLGAVTHTAKVRAGSRVVIIGAGGVGLNSVQGAVLAGASQVIVLDIVASKLEAARSFGATHTVNVSIEDAPGAVEQFTGGRGADYVFVTVGSTAAMQQGLGLLRRGGTITLVGMPAVGAKLELEAVDFASNAQTMLGAKMGSVLPQKDLPELVELYQAGRLKLDELISNRYPLTQINEAIAEVKRGEVLRNIIVFES